MSTYNRVIRKLVVGFGNLFDSITLYRFKPDLTESKDLLFLLRMQVKNVMSCALKKI